MKNAIYGFVVFYFVGPFFKLPWHSGAMGLRFHIFWTLFFYGKKMVVDLNILHWFYLA